MSKRPLNPARRPPQAAFSAASAGGATNSGGAPTAASRATGPAKAGVGKPVPLGPLGVLREWADALVIAFVLAMFIRIFLVELFKIPSGSMTPTLVGGQVAMVDFNRDGLKDMLLFLQNHPLLFLNDGHGGYDPQGFVTVPPDLQGEVNRTLHERNDRILVNKLAYWFRQPRRGEIVVFKVPPAIWQADKPIYIKRTAGEPGDHLTFDPEGHLIANGERVTSPDFYKTQRYGTSPMGASNNLPEITYDRTGAVDRITRIDVPDDKIYVFGDNTHSSMDSRYWGGVPLDNVKGRAFFRYVPFNEMRFFRGSPRHSS